MSPTEQRIGDKRTEEEERIFKNSVFCPRHVRVGAQVAYPKRV